MRKEKSFRMWTQLAGRPPGTRVTWRGSRGAVRTQSPDRGHGRPRCSGCDGSVQGCRESALLSPSQLGAAQINKHKKTDTWFCMGLLRRSQRTFRGSYTRLLPVEIDGPERQPPLPSILCGSSQTTVNDGRLRNEGHGNEAFRNSPIVQ